MSKSQTNEIASLRIELEEAKKHLRDTLWMAEKWADCEHSGHPTLIICLDARNWLKEHDPK